MKVTLLISFSVVKPRRHAVDRRFAQELHAFLLGQLADFRSGLLLQNDFPDRIGQLQQFVDRRSSAIAGTSAFDAACPFAEVEVPPLGGIQSAVAQKLVVVPNGVDAVFADGTHQPLRQDAVERGDEVVCLDAHVEKASQHVEDVVGVDRGEHQVSGERGVDGDLRRLLVADFADQDLVRIVAQDGAQIRGQR